MLLPILVLTLRRRRGRRRLSRPSICRASSRRRCSRPTSRRPRRPAPGGCATILVVGQFAVSIGLIICTAVVYAQTVYARTVDPGYRRDGLIQVENLGRRQLMRAGGRDRRRDRAGAGRRRGRPIAASASPPRTTTTPASRSRARPSRSRSAITTVDPGFFETMGIKLVAGRLFDREPPGRRHRPALPGRRPSSERALAARGVNIVINELAARRMGFRSPADAVGKTVSVDLVNPENGGVVAGAHHRRRQGFPLPLDPRADRSDHVRQWTDDCRNPARPPRRPRSAGRAQPGRAGLEAARPRSAVRRRVQRGHRIAELYEAEEARAKVFAGFASSR